MMQETPEAKPVKPSAPPAEKKGTHRDLQRLALHDLVVLSTECAATEARIEAQRKADEEANAETHTVETEQLQQQFRQERDALQRGYDKQTAQIAEEFDNDARVIKSQARKQRQRIEHEHGTVEKDVKEKFQQASWLAESVFDGTLHQIRVDFTKTKEQIEAHLEEVTAQEMQAFSLLDLYSYKPQPDTDAPPEPEIPLEEAEAAFASKRSAIEQYVTQLRRLRLPRLFVGVQPYLMVFLICALAAVGTQAYFKTTEPQFRQVGIAVGAALVGTIILGIILRVVAKRHVGEVYRPLRRMIDSSRRAAQRQLDFALQTQERAEFRATKTREAEVSQAKHKFSPVLAQSARTRDAASSTIEAEVPKKMSSIETRRDAAQQESDAAFEEARSKLGNRESTATQGLEQRHAQRVAAATKKYEDGRLALERRWNEALERIKVLIDEKGRPDGQQHYDWNDPIWQNFKTPAKFPPVVRFGELQVDLKQIAGSVPRDEGRFKLALPDKFEVPALLAFPRQASLLLQSDRAGREHCIRGLQMVMTRLLTSLPAGRVRFTLLDPVGLGQNFAGFMHLADHDEALVGGRIWTTPEQIDQRLADLTEHMETVIQKYLRNEFETIDEYNAQAGELAEPYRFLVIADFPASFSDDACRRLSSIASSGARCGVYTLIARDMRMTIPAPTTLDDLESHSVNLVRQGDRFVWKDAVFGQFGLTLDPPASDDTLTRILDIVGQAAREANRVEVPFDIIAPEAADFWKGDTAEDLKVPIGRAGATRLQMMRLGRGVAQHALIAGKTGSGKSTLLHALITNLAMWYDPDQVEMFLIDFKKGVEFKTYATHNLPHARAIAVESDREFGLSVLQRLDAELERRGTLFRKSGVQDLAAYRKSPGSIPMPRSLLIVDEFQEFFSEDDKLAQDSAVLLDRLVRQGRAFGIHILLGSQTIGGSSGLARSTIGQMAVRIALQTSEADSQLILGDSNSAARLLSRPGEAIYNDQGGLVEGNSPFQIAWLPDEKRDVYLDRVSASNLKRGGNHHQPAIIFEGNAPADITKNQRLARWIDAKESTALSAPVQAWLGEPVAIKDPTAILFRRQSGANVLIVGQHEEAAMSIMSAMLISIASQQSPDAAQFYVMDGSPADSPLAAVMPRVKAALAHDVKMVEYRSVPEAITELAAEMTRRQGGEEAHPPSIYVFIYGLQRYRALRKQEEAFSFSTSDEEKKPEPDKLFADLIREGPSLGIHIIAWSDTPVSIDRTLDRAAMREFDNRVLFQMSSADSSNLIDSPAANKLGFYRALAYSEEQGVMEKFRPYGLPGKEWLEQLKTRMGSKTNQPART